MDAVEICRRIHEALDALPRWHEPSQNLPLKGIYFFYEDGEMCSHTGKHRIVRVGIHGERSSLRKRLMQHYRLNREGSVFRKHLGSALLKKAGVVDNEIREWNKKRRSLRWAEFKDTEREVSKLLRSKFFFRVVSVEDPNERKRLEVKLIATLASCPSCKPSDSWLGQFAWNEKVKRSGLWNSNFVYSPTEISREDVATFEQLACETSISHI